MAILDKTKLLLKKKSEIAKANAKFKINLELEKLFFSIPPKIELLKMAAMLVMGIIVSDILKGGYTKENTKTFLRTDTRTKTILDFTSTDINEDNLSEILLACYKQTSLNNIKGRWNKVWD